MSTVKCEMPPTPLDLLAALLRDPPDLSLPADPISWRIIKDNAGRHGAAPIVAYLARPHVPAEERVWCDRVLTRSWRLHARNLRALGILLNALDRGGVRTLSLKGPLLALRYYQPPFIRKSSTDLDLAVAESDVERACDILASLGYREDVPFRHARFNSHHVELSHADLPKLELHFRLSHGALGIPVSGLFEWSEPQEMPDGPAALVLDPPGQLLHLMLHRAWGRYATLFHLYEIRRIAEALPAATLEEAVRRAANCRFGGVVTLTNVAFRERWGRPLLPAGLEVPRTWLGGRIDRRLYRRFEEFSDPNRDLPLTARLARRWVDFQLTDGPAEALRFTGIMAQVAFYQLFAGGWRTVRPARVEHAPMEDTQARKDYRRIY